MADDSGVRREIIRVQRGTGGLAGVVAHIERLDGDEARTANSAAKPGDRIVVDQQDHEFIPRVVAVRAGEPVTFRNSDPANHNVRALTTVAANEFNVYTGIGGEHVRRFAAVPDGRPIRLGCDIHPWMTGWVYVFEHPFFAVTDDAGRFRISGVPPGEYRLTVRQPDLRYAQEREITIEAGEVEDVNLEVRKE